MTRRLTYEVTVISDSPDEVDAEMAAATEFISLGGIASNVWAKKTGDVEDKTGDYT